MVKDPPATAGDAGVRPLGWEDPLEEEISIHFSILAWKIPWLEEPGGLQSMGLHRIRHSWACTHRMESRKMMPMNIFARQEWRCRQRTDMWTQWEKEEGWTNWDGSTDIYTPPYVKWIASWKLLCSTRSSAQRSVWPRGVGWRVGGRLKREGIYIYTCSWFTLLCSRNYNNIIKQLYSNKIFSKKRK